MIDVIDPRLIRLPGLRLLAVLKLSLPCGCRAFLGQRLDTAGDALYELPCSRRHIPMWEQFEVVIAETVQVFPELPLAVICDEALTIMYRLHQPPRGI